MKKVGSALRRKKRSERHEKKQNAMSVSVKRGKGLRNSGYGNKQKEKRNYVSKRFCVPEKKDKSGLFQFSQRSWP